MKRFLSLRVSPNLMQGLTHLSLPSTRISDKSSSHEEKKNANSLLVLSTVCVITIAVLMKTRSFAVFGFFVITKSIDNCRLVLTRCNPSYK